MKLKKDTDMMPATKSLEQSYIFTGFMETQIEWLECFIKYAPPKVTFTGMK